MFLLAVRFGSRQAILQEFDLAVVVRLVFTDMKPFAVIIRGSPTPGLVNSREPCVVTLAKFGKGLLARLAEQIQIIVEAVSLDRFASRFAEFHGYAPLFLVRTRQLLEVISF